MSIRAVPAMKRSRIRQVLQLPGRDDATKPDLAGVGWRYISADVAPRCGIYAVSTSDDARHDVIAFLEVQAHSGGLVGYADQPMTQLDAFRRDGGCEETLKGRAMECQQRRAHLLPVPLPYWMRPDEPTVPPAAELKSWRHIRNLGKIYTKTLQQTSRITADSDPGPDLPKFSVLLENPHRYRLAHQASRERKATNAPANNGNVTAADHICCLPALTRHRPVPAHARSACPLPAVGLPPPAPAKQPGRRPSGCPGLAPS